MSKSAAGAARRARQESEVAVDLAATRGIVPLRDSKDPGGPVLTVPAAAFSAFVSGVRAGTFDAV
ncbi:DUF397 domain-containing protein [Streptomyces cyaneofuscatus]|uniref:DUF397 domain-containing protein n=1 Tax=Streptomyces cyaneofuscatus TaxID=66883 RepID=UPI003F4D04CA